MNDRKSNGKFYKIIIGVTLPGALIIVLICVIYLLRDKKKRAKDFGLLTICQSNSSMREKNECPQYDKPRVIDVREYVDELVC